MNFNLYLLGPLMDFDEPITRCAI